jgi:hypothetical protein
MSGSSRAILLKLSVADADVVRSQLEQMGAAGERALQRLDAAARAATGSGSSGPVTRGGSGGGGGGFGGLRSAIGQAGFQLQDFVVQVQAGTSALTALGQQGSQFLGAFGAGGAAAGAVLVMGTLVAQFLSGSREAEELRKVAEEGFKNTGKAAEELRDILRDINALYGTQAQIAARAANETRDLLAARLRVQENNAVLFLEDSAAQIATATRDRDAAARNLALLEQQAARGSVVQPGDLANARGRLFAAEARLAGLQQDIQRQQAALTRIAEGRAQLANAGRDTGEEYGPPTPPGVGDRRRGGDADTVEATLERLRREQAARFERERNQFEDLVARVDPLSNALRAYERGQQALNRFLQEGIISQDEFTEAVERTTLALGREIEEIEKRGNRANDISRELGLTFSSAFEDAIVKGKSLREVLGGIAQDIARIITRQTITTPLANAASALLQPITSGLGNFFGGLFRSPVAAGGGNPALPFGGPRAAGGPVNPGYWYMVGERGPEAFIPHVAGAIAPNGAMGGTTIVMNINAQGAGPREIDVLRMQIPAIARAAVEDAARRGGASARNIRGR